MKLFLFWVGVANIALGLLMGGFLLMNMSAFIPENNTTGGMLGLLFLPLAPLVTGVLMMMVGWPRKA